MPVKKIEFINKNNLSFILVFMSIIGIVAKLSVEALLPLSPLSSGHAIDLGCAECVEAVHEGDADMDLARLPVWVSRGDALAEGLQAAHFCLVPASNVKARPLLPVRPVEAPTLPDRPPEFRGRLEFCNNDGLMPASARIFHRRLWLRSHYRRILARPGAGPSPWCMSCGQKAWNG